MGVFTKNLGAPVSTSFPFTKAFQLLKIAARCNLKFIGSLELDCSEEQEGASQSSMKTEKPDR